MVKKKVTKKATKKKTITKPQKVIIQQMPAPKAQGIDSVLLENFVALQRVLTNLSVKLDNVSNQMTKLLDLFEISAKALAEKDYNLEPDNTEVIDKLDSLLGQNKTIARGLTLLHERTNPVEQMPPVQQIPIKPLPPPIKPLPQNPSMPSQKKQSYIQELPSSMPNMAPPRPNSPIKPMHEEDFNSEPKFESPME